MSSNRSKPFSGKKKKEQLQLKKQMKNMKLKSENNQEESNCDQSNTTEFSPEKRRTRINLKSDWDVVGAANAKPQDNILYQNEIIPLYNSWRHASFESVFGENSSSLMIPVRPEWDYNLSKERLEESENIYFQSWLKGVYEKVQDRNTLSFFEHNLEVWRQLWRVCEISNVLVIVADIRNPIVHLPPSFCNYVTQALGKPLIIALTKSDLVSENLRMEWTNYINQNFSEVKIHFVSTFDALDKNGTKRQKRYINATGVVGLLEDIKSYSTESSLSSQWNKAIMSIKSRIQEEKKSDSLLTEGSKAESLFTIGFIGQPNVGKSSLINSIFGKKVVSASRTPGHTKHFQTLHLTAGIRVCDSPGLVFPSIIDKNLQILSGIYNIAQVKDPYGPILYLAQRIDLYKILDINQSRDPTQPSSVFYICEEYAKKCGFITSKAGRPDTYRAANLILRQVIDGKIILSWTPPGYEEDLVQLSNLKVPNEYESEFSENESEDSDEIIEEIFNFQSKCRFSVLDENFE